MDECKLSFDKVIFESIRNERTLYLNIISANATVPKITTNGIYINNLEGFLFLYKNTNVIIFNDTNLTQFPAKLRICLLSATPNNIISITINAGSHYSVGKKIGSAILMWSQEY